MTPCYPYGAVNCGTFISAVLINQVKWRQE